MDWEWGGVAHSIFKHSKSLIEPFHNAQSHRSASGTLHYTRCMNQTNIQPRYKRQRWSQSRQEGLVDAHLRALHNSGTAKRWTYYMADTCTDWRQWASTVFASLKRTTWVVLIFPLFGGGIPSSISRLLIKVSKTLSIPNSRIDVVDSSSSSMVFPLSTFARVRCLLVQAKMWSLFSGQISWK